MAADILSTIVQGVLLGGLYALFAAGLSLMFGVMRLVNLAHGDFIVLAAYMAMGIVSTLGIHPLLTLVIFVPVMAAMGYSGQRILLNRVVTTGLLPPLMVTFGLSIIVQNLLLELFSADSRRLSVGALDTASIALPGEISVGVVPLIMFLTAFVILAGRAGSSAIRSRASFCVRFRTTPRSSG